MLTITCYQRPKTKIAIKLIYKVLMKPRRRRRIMVIYEPKQYHYWIKHIINRRKKRKKHGTQILEIMKNVGKRLEEIRRIRESWRNGDWRNIQKDKGKLERCVITNWGLENNWKCGRNFWFGDEQISRRTSNDASVKEDERVRCLIRLYLICCLSRKKKNSSSRFSMFDSLARELERLHWW